MNLELPAPDRTLVLPDGRTVAFDDRGDPDGDAVVFLHGTPDTRLARHPDDSIAATQGWRVLAVDRPGLGGSSVDPSATPRSVAADHVAVLDEVGAHHAHVVAWSAGAIFGLALAGLHPDRVASLTLVAPLVPADAYDDADVLVGSGDSRRMFAEVFPTMSPEETGRELAMWLVPSVIDEATAREILAPSLARMTDIGGADAAFVAALRGSVAQGMTGLEREIAAQATRLDTILDRVVAPVAVHVGSDDDVTPPAMARWLATRLGGSISIHDGETHSIGVIRWAEILGGLPR